MAQQNESDADFAGLTGLALDLHCFWDHSSDVIWRRLDPALWGLTHNPWVVLQSVSHDRIRELCVDPTFRQRVDDELDGRRRAAASVGWFRETYPAATLKCIAYFSMEFMLSESLPIYAGGLGNVAGDQLKAASDLGVPMVGLGLLYSQGYFRQAIDRDGTQRAIYPFNEPGQLPVSPLRLPNGQWLRVVLDLPGRQIWLRAWYVVVGRICLYLLDSNDAANDPADRAITAELYGGSAETRLLQEFVLGIAGWRLLMALGLDPEVCHLNEGHAAFAVLERARTFMQASGQSFAVALAATRAGNVFTTHTAVGAGFDRFDTSLMQRYLQSYAERDLKVPFEDLLALGRADVANADEPFNMAYLAVRGSGAVNGVSRLHEAVSRRLFEPLFRRWPASDIPIGHVTNGVHMPSWDSAAADELWTVACGKDRWRESVEPIKARIRQVSDVAVWHMRNAARLALVEYSRKRLKRQRASSGEGSEASARAGTILDSEVLTVGFARRFAEYKRPDLLLKDPERLLRLLNHRDRPVQIILAGKAHPADRVGQALIRRWFDFIRRPEAQGRVIFLEDYDVHMAEHLVQGCDVWLNTPRRPWEASGTSGMKVLVNGGLNVSELDGWWAEAYAPDIGWAIGDGQEHDDADAWDSAEAQSLYRVLEDQVVPEFYARAADGIPTAWVARIRESMARLTPHFSTNRVMKEYTDRYYLPAQRKYLERSRDRGADAVQLVQWRQGLETRWKTLRFGSVKTATVGGEHRVELTMNLGTVDPGDIRVELYAEMQQTSDCERLGMSQDASAVGAAGQRVYKARFPAHRPISDYTPRVLSYRDGVAIPLEEPVILWSQ